MSGRREPIPWQESTQPDPLPHNEVDLAERHALVKSRPGRQFRDGMFGSNVGQIGPKWDNYKYTEPKK